MFSSFESLDECSEYGAAEARTTAAIAQEQG